MVAFNSIPVAFRLPGANVEFDTSRANQGLALQTYKILVLAQKLSTGNAPAGEAIRITSEFAAVQAAGQGSMAHGMFRALFANNTFTEAYLLPLDDPSGGAKATGTISVSGSPTAAGTLFVYVSGRRIQVGVQSTSTPTTIASAIAQGINADASGYVTASASGSDVTVTARHSGVLGNEINLRINYNQGETTPPGISVSINPMAGGSGVVDLDAVWPALGDEWYNAIATPFTDAAALTSLEAELEDRFGGLRQIDGVAYAAHSGNLTAVSTFGASRNSPHLSVQHSFGSPSPTWEWAGAFAGMAAFELANDPGRPLQTVALRGILPAKPADRFSGAERNSLLFGGVGTNFVDAGGVVRMEFAVTTYTENPLGAPDTAYLKVNTLATLSYLRFSLRARILTRFPRSKLAEDGTRFAPGQPVVTPLAFRGELIAIFRQWEERGLVQDVDQFKRDLVVVKVGDTLEVILPPALINQLRTTKVQVQFTTEAVAA